jgi:Tfp pilus assembly protein PilX
MSKTTRSASFHTQSGGITILVALSLLVLLTIAAVGMSRNSFREVVISGTSRQGAMVRNAADAGIEWSIYWLDLSNAPNATQTSTQLIALKSDLLLNEIKSGKPFNVVGGLAYSNPTDIASLDTDQKFPTVGETQQGFSTSLTRMGKLPITDMSQGITQGNFAPSTGAISKQAPDLWAVRSDGQLQAGTDILAPTFLHSKEAWISTPVQ